MVLRHVPPIDISSHLVCADARTSTPRQFCATPLAPKTCQPLVCAARAPDGGCGAAEVASNSPGAAMCARCAHPMAAGMKQKWRAIALVRPCARASRTPSALRASGLAEVACNSPGATICARCAPEVGVYQVLRASEVGNLTGNRRF